MKSDDYLLEKYVELRFAYLELAKKYNELVKKQESEETKND